MAYEGILGSIPGLKANADLSSSQFRFVKLTSGKVAQCSVAGEGAIGVLQDKPSAANQAANVCALVGVSKVVAGAAVAQGAKVTTDNQGRAATWATGNHLMGYALNAASAAGEVIEVVLVPYGID